MDELWKNLESGEQGLKKASGNEKYWGWVKPKIFSLPPFLPSSSLPSFLLPSFLSLFLSLPEKLLYFQRKHGKINDNSVGLAEKCTLHISVCVFSRLVVSDSL